MRDPRNGLAACLSIMLLVAAGNAVTGTIAPTLSASDAVGPPGTTRRITFSADRGDATLGGVQFELAVPVQVRASAASAAGPGGGTGVACGTPSASRLICLIFNNGGALPAPLAITVDFTIEAGAAFGVAPLNFTDVQFIDPDANDIQPGTSRNGSITVVQAGPAVFSSDPAPDVPIQFGPVVHGQSADRTILVRNIALADFQPLTIQSCQITGAAAFSLLAPAQFPVTITAGSASDLVLRMRSSIDLGNPVVGDLRCSMNNGAQTFDASWPLTGLAVTERVLTDGFESP